MSLNRVNYFRDPTTLTKAQSGQAVGNWRQWQDKINPNFDPTKAYYIVLSNGQGCIDFDIITKEKLLEDKKKLDTAKQNKKKYNPKFKDLPYETRKKILDGHKFDYWELVQKYLKKFGLPETSYIVQTGSGGFHYYLKLHGAKLHNTAGLRFIGNLAIDFRAHGGLLYAEGTQWKDRPEPYKRFQGDPEQLPVVDSWRIAWAIGLINHQVYNVDMGAFLNGTVDLDDLNINPNCQEFVIFREAMYLLKNTQHTAEDVYRIFGELPLFKAEECKSQINYWWDREGELTKDGRQPVRSQHWNSPHKIKPNFQKTHLEHPIEQEVMQIRAEVNQMKLLFQNVLTALNSPKKRRRLTQLDY